MDLRSRTRLARLLAALGVLLLAAGALLSIPQARSAGDAPVLDVLLVDVSRSVVARAEGAFAAETDERLRAFAEGAARAGHDVAVVTFGRDVRAAFAPAAARTLVAGLAAGRLRTREDLLAGGDPAGAARTELDGALALAAALVRGRGRASITVLSDGTWTGADPLPRARELAESGVEIALERVPPRASNLALAPLVLPRELEAGAPLVAATRVRLDPGETSVTEARVEFEARDSVGVRRATVRVPFDGAGEVPVHAELGPARAGILTLSAQVFVEQGGPDPLPEDDRSEARVRCAGSVLVGLVSEDELGLARWRGSGAANGLEWVQLRESEFLPDLARVDAIVTEDLPLTSEQSSALTHFVERGGGWLDLAGPRWVRARAGADRLGALVPDRGSLPARDVLFLIDASGSMAGAPFESVRAHLDELVESALPGDDVAVRFFAAELSEPVRFGDGSMRDDADRRAQAVAAALGARTPHGPTHLLRALAALVAGRRADGRELLVLLLSDGRDPEQAEFESRLDAWRADRARAGVRIVAVAPTSDVDARLLERVSDRYVALQADRATWSDVFRRELAAEALEHDRRIDLVAVRTDDDPAATIVRALPEVPPLAALARARLTDGAQPLWTDDGGRPAAAIARRGLGLAATLAFVPGSDWAPAWSAHAHLSALLRALARSSAPRTRAPRLTLEDGRIVLSGIAAGFPALARARARLSNGDEIAFELVAGRAGYDPRSARTAAAPSGLDDDGRIVTVHVEGGASGELDLELEGARGGEFAYEPRRFEPPRVRNGGARDSDGRHAHPLARVGLLAGLLVLGAAAWLGAFTRTRA